MGILSLATLYIHLIACCVAIGLLLTHDIGLVKRLLKAGNDRRNYIDHLLSLKDTISIALAVLWVSGLLLVCIDAAMRGVESLSNPKLHAKLAIVVLLTLNGFLIHGTVIPSLQKAGALLNLEFKPRMLAIFAGSVSAVSWFYAAMLGVGRPLAWKYSLLELLLVYPFLVAAGFGAMALLIALADQRRHTALGDPGAATALQRGHS
jgi:hypothetical protein